VSIKRVKTCYACYLILGAGIAAAQETDDRDPFAFFVTRDTRPLDTIIETDYIGHVEVGLGYVSEDSFTFGRYNGLEDKGFLPTYDMDLSGADNTGWLSGLVTQWRLQSRDLGLGPSLTSLVFGRAGDYNVSIGYDKQVQVLNNTGSTPFAGGTLQTLPDNWVASNITSGMTELFDVSRQFDRELERERWRLAMDKNLGAWRLGGGFSSEEKTGNQTMGAALYVDASNGHAAVLNRPVDFTTNQLDLSLGFAKNKLALDVSYLYSDFDNSDDALTWQNPYSNVFGPGIDYPEGFGRMALEPDNEMQRIRATGVYRFTPRLRLHLDGSYAESTQDQNFLPFTVNNLPGAGALPRNNADGEVKTSTFNGNVHYRPARFPRLTLKTGYHYEERDNKGPRDGYLYARGDAWAPTDDKFTVWNTTHDRSVNRAYFEGAYRLGWWRSKLTLRYGYEEVERYNTAVEKTEEDIFTGKLTLRPTANFDARLKFEYRDRGASTYQWDQSFFALLDTALINEIPDNQRYITHPSLSQFHLSNREQILTRLTLAYVPSESWNLMLDFSYTDNDYDKTQLGLEEDKLTHVTLSASYTPQRSYSVSVFYSFDRYEAEQTGRAFRGGIEKDAFDTVPPLAQASDPSRNWRVSPEDTTNSVGMNAEWEIIADRLDMEWEYTFYDAEGESDFSVSGAPDLSGTPLPDNTSRQHQFRWLTRYNLRESLSLGFEYQYFRFKGEDWAQDNVRLDSIDKVLWTGQQSPSDVVHYFLITAQYRLRQ
jgi:MtrB/PioB family decaheme-associated outer membrane protein